MCGGCHITVKVLEEIYDVELLDFLCQQISLVHEENYGGVVEPWVGNDGFEQLNTFFHATLQTENRRKITSKRKWNIKAAEPFNFHLNSVVESLLKLS